MNRQISISIRKWPLAKPFVISRSSRTETSTVTVSIMEDRFRGVGEGVANPRYSETDQSVAKQIQAVEQEIAKGIDREKLRHLMQPGAARNAVDCALWDLEAKRSGKNVGILSGLGWPKNVHTVQTISILSPQEMNREANNLSDYPVIKVKLNAERVLERVQAVHQGAPNAQLIIDANESWTPGLLTEMATKLADLNVEMIEQPLPDEQDDVLADFESPIPLFADESCHIPDDLSALRSKYQGINIKLDKTGGLTEAIDLLQAAKAEKFEIMVGCMLGTSLGMAPAMFLANHCRFVDIDGPAWLAENYENALKINNGQVSELDGNLWGGS